MKKTLGVVSIIAGIISIISIAILGYKSVKDIVSYIESRRKK